MRNDIIERREEIIQWVRDKCFKAYICRQLNCKPSTLDRYLHKIDICYEGNPGARGHKPSPKRKKAEDYLHYGSAIIAHKLKLKIVEDGIRQWCCEQCGLYRWLNNPIPLELHHINGDIFDNRLENLQLLCPNCHALTANHAGKGIGKQKSQLGKW